MFHDSEWEINLNIIIKKVQTPSRPFCGKDFIGEDFAVRGFLWLRLAWTALCCGAQLSHCGGLACCGARARGAQLQ